MGQKNGPVYQWAKKGARRRQPKDPALRQCLCIRRRFPGRDTGAAIALPCWAMQQHDEITHVCVSAHAAQVLDKAGWHTT